VSVLIYIIVADYHSPKKFDSEAREFSRKCETLVEHIIYIFKFILFNNYCCFGYYTMWQIIDMKKIVEKLWTEQCVWKCLHAWNSSN